MTSLLPKLAAKRGPVFAQACDQLSQVFHGAK
jgi:hypothetical protein